MKYAIYELTPAPWGDQYRYVARFEKLEWAQDVLNKLESYNIDFNVYKIVDFSEPKNIELLKESES